MLRIIAILVLSGLSSTLLWGAPPPELGLNNGVWLPVSGMLSTMPISRLGTHMAPTNIGYAIGHGDIYQQSCTQVGEWKNIGSYAPKLSWDEAEGISASGDFSIKLLNRLEGQLTELLEEQLDQQGDEEWLSEDAAYQLIESFMNEQTPSADSPFRVYATKSDQQVTWLSTGTDIWRLSTDGVERLPSPSHPPMSIQAMGVDLWASGQGKISVRLGKLSQVGNLPQVRDSLQMMSSIDRNMWRHIFEEPSARLTQYKNTLWILSQRGLFTLQPDQTLRSIHSAAPFSDNSDLFIDEERLWALHNTELYSTMDPEQGWSKCTQYPYPPHTIRYSEGWIIAIGSQHIWLHQSGCNAVFELALPLSASVSFNDALIMCGMLYAATTGGVFQWQSGGRSSALSTALRYLKRELRLYPSLDQIYQAALEENQLSSSATRYGLRPVLSAFLPELTMSYRTHPQRRDQVPSFSTGTRQLQLNQPRPEYRLMATWKLSFDYVSRLFDPIQGSAYAEVEQQLTSAYDAPGSDMNVEDLLGIPEEWDQDVVTTQAQRLAQSVVALERRQMHRDREQLRQNLLQLYRERLQLTERLRLSPPDSLDQRNEWMMRIQELDVHLDSLSGQRLKIYDKMHNRNGSQ